MSIGWYATYNDFGATWGKKIGAVGIAIYQALASRAWEGQCFPSYQTIAEDTGVSRPTAIKYIKRLQDAGLIEVQPRHNRRGDPTSNLYTLPDLPLLNKKKAQAASQPAKPVDTSGMSEAEIAESVRKSHFVSRPKKKAVTPESVPDAAPATSEISPPNSPITKAVEAVNSEPAVTPVVQSQIQPPPATVVPAPTPPAAPTPSVQQAPASNVQQEKPLNFGLLSDKSDQVAARHLLKNVPNKQEVLDELNKAIRENRIQTTAIQYLGGLVKKVAQGEFVPSANKKTEDELFIEKKQRAVEQNRTAKQAIADCEYCNDSGYLVFSTISPFKPQSIVCTHNEKSAEMVRKLTEQEDNGKVITYFGKQDKDKMLDMGGSVMQVIREVVSPVSKTTAQSTDSTTSSHAAAPTQPTAPVPEPVHKSPPTQPITSDVPETQAENKAESVPSQTSETPSNKEGGFKTIMQVVEEALAEKARRDAEKQAREQPQKLEEPEEPETPERKLETFLSDLLEDDETDDLDDDIFEVSKEISTVETATASGYPSSMRGKPIREKVLQKIAAANADIERFYGTIEIILNIDVIRYLRLQILVRLARSRALLEREAEKIGERNYHATVELLERIDKSYKKLKTSISLRKVFEAVNRIIEMLQPTPLDSPQRLLDARQERAVIRRSLRQILKNNAGWAEVERTGKTEHEREVAKNIRLQQGRLAWALLLEEQQPTLPFEELHEMIPKEYQYPPDKLQEVLAFKAEREAAEKEERARRTPEAEIIEAQALELKAKTNKP